jgi:hypothetical protein
MILLVLLAIVLKLEQGSEKEFSGEGQICTFPVRSDCC